MDLAHDLAHQQTEKDLARLERRVRKVYKEAQKDLQTKMDDFTRRFAAKDKIHQQELKDGKITEAEYKRWLSGQIFQGKQWKSKLDQLTDTLVNADQVARKLINGQVYGVFANNANWQAYDLEHGAGINFGFELYDPSTVARLLREQPQLLPPRKVDVPKDQRWSKTKITQQITQGIIQGERLDQIASRLQAVTGMQRNYALTNARTAMTGAQNAGRQDCMNRAKDMGIKVKKEWLATLDHHTRFSHALLDGQSVDMDKPFKSELGPIMYPGDPHAEPANVYNCRCTMIADLVDYPDSFNAPRYDNIDGAPVKGMSYKDWYKAKTGQDLVKKPVETVEKQKPQPKKVEKVLQMMGIRGTLNTEYVDKMQDILENTDNPNLRNMFYRYGNDIQCVDPNSRKGAYYSPARRGVVINQDRTAQGDSCHLPYQNFFHEFAHNIDYLGGGEEYYFSIYYKKGALPGLIKSDYKAFKKAMGAKSNAELISMLKAEDLDKYDRADLSDVLEGCTGISYPLGVGHGASYHKKWVGATAVEFFAEVCDSAAANPGSLAQLRRVFPRSVALVEEMMEVLAK